MTEVMNSICRRSGHGTQSRLTVAVALTDPPFEQSVSSIYSFFLAMTLYPEVQRKAQQELDSVVGTDRLPSFSDRSRLPYVCAVVSETLRWMPVVYSSSYPSLTRRNAVLTYLIHVVLRKTTEDFTYKGYEIPRGAYIHANVW